MPEERILDCRGLMGPMPSVKTRRTLAEMEQGTVKVLVDTETAGRIVARAAERLGATARVGHEGPQWHVLIAKGEVAEGPSGAAVTKAVVLVTSATLGQGDDALGGILMKAFLYALGQLPSPPSAVILTNSGVRLALEGSEELATLRSLVEAGTDVMVCGTSLDHFGLTDKIAVGRVSNIYEIIEALGAASRVISP